MLKYRLFWSGDLKQKHYKLGLIISRTRDEVNDDDALFDLSLAKSIVFLFRER